MGRPGRKPRPTALSGLADPARKPIGDNEPVPRPGDVVAPAWLSKAARAHWDTITPVLARSTPPILTTADVIPFARYCEDLARYVSLLRWQRQYEERMAKLQEESRRAAEDGAEPESMANVAAREAMRGLVYPILTAQGRVSGVAKLPQQSEIDTLAARLLKLEHHFGCTPAARAAMRMLPTGATPTSETGAVGDASDDVFTGGGPVGKIGPEVA
jgi:phage terminase small subunit